jgi:DNA replication protein DnaC
MTEQDFNAEWLADRLARRISIIRNMRPERLTAKGELLPEIAEWGSRLFDNTAGNLVLVGGVGTGKTWSVWEVLERAVAAGYAGRICFASAAEWQEAVGPPLDRDRLRDMRQADVLVLDDLGSGRINEWQRECLLAVVDERWANARPVVITTNMAKLKEPLGERLASRLKDGATVVIIDGPDRRSAK